MKRFFSFFFCLFAPQNSRFCNSVILKLSIYGNLLLPFCKSIWIFLFRICLIANNFLTIASGMKTFRYGGKTQNSNPLLSLSKKSGGTRLCRVEGNVQESFDTMEISDTFFFTLWLLILDYCRLHSPRWAVVSLAIARNAGVVSRFPFSSFLIRRLLSFVELLWLHI